MQRRLAYRANRIAGCSEQTADHCWARSRSRDARETMATLLRLLRPFRFETVSRSLLFRCILRWSDVHVVIPPGRSVDARLSRHAAYICGELPYLIGSDLAAKRRHSVGPALNNCRVNLLGTTAVDPLVIHQRDAHAAATMGVAADAVECLIKPFPFRNGIGVVLIVVNRDCFQDFARLRRLLQVKF